MDPSADSGNPGFEGGASLSSPRPTQATLLSCRHIPAPATDLTASPACLGPRAVLGVRTALGPIGGGGAQSRNLPRPPAVAVGTGRRSYGGRRDPNSSPPLFPCESSAAADFPAVTEPKGRIPAAAHLRRTLRRYRGRQSRGHTITLLCDFRQVPEPH